MRDKPLLLASILATALLSLGIGYSFYTRHQTRAIVSPSIPDANDATSSLPAEDVSVYEYEQAFLPAGLHTNTSLHSVPLEQVIASLPYKGTIPALTDPLFTSLTNVDPRITSDSLGILVTSGSEQKFYPYNILLWHQVVNDTISGSPITITFCPLCASAMVFDATVDAERILYGVSGKIYDSNLLLYDIETESLWSQVHAEAIVGDYTGTLLSLFPSQQILSLLEVQQQYPDAQVLSTDTGYEKDYAFNPYTLYDEEHPPLFATSLGNTALPGRTLLHVVQTPNGYSVAFDRAALMETSSAVLHLPDGTHLFADVVDGNIVTRFVQDNIPRTISGYTAQWFAWVPYHQADGILWTSNLQEE